MNIIAVDWARNRNKRSAYLAEPARRFIRRMEFDGSLVQLLDFASRLTPPTLIGIDAAIGFPRISWARLEDHCSTPPDNFIDFLHGGSLPDDFFQETSNHHEWSPLHPFVSIPKGTGAKTAFVEAAKGGFYRDVDQRLAANSPFIVSGIPGTVGSGSRALWQELIALQNRSSLRIWPFDGRLNTLTRKNTPILAEIYPKACYGIALAEALPTPLCSIAKTKKPARKVAIEQLLYSKWIVREKITLHNVIDALDNEDDFDALMSAAALLRVFLEAADFDNLDTIDPIAEGGVMGEASLTPPPRRKVKKSVKVADTGKKQKTIAKQFPCPIADCKKVFFGGRGGWDAHVASFKRHPHWNPGIKDPFTRKQFFREEFSEWFKK